jgi:hypothetical protein
LRSLKVDASPVAGVFAVNVSCLAASSCLEHADTAKLPAKAQAIKRCERVNDINNPFHFNCYLKAFRISKKNPTDGNYSMRSVTDPSLHLVCWQD